MALSSCALQLLGIKQLCHGTLILCTAAAERLTAVLCVFNSCALKVTDCGVRGLGFKSPGSILTSRTETSSLSRVVNDGWDRCSVTLSDEKKVSCCGVFDLAVEQPQLFRKLPQKKQKTHILCSTDSHILCCTGTSYAVLARTSYAVLVLTSYAVLALTPYAVLALTSYAVLALTSYAVLALTSYTVLALTSYAVLALISYAVLALTSYAVLALTS